MLVENKHTDGTVSILHLGLTLGGRRDLVCYQPGLPDSVLPIVPGTVYFGMLTGPEHQVFHRPCNADELIDAIALGPTSVTVMVRTGLFPNNNSRRMWGKGSHPLLFDVMQKSFLSSLHTETFSLPSLDECKEAEAKLYLTLPTEEALPLQALKGSPLISNKWKKAKVTKADGPKVVHKKPVSAKSSTVQQKAANVPQNVD